jgi:hypothetical protein
MKIYRTTLSEVKKLVSEQVTDPSSIDINDIDVMDAVSAMGEMVDEHIARAKNRLKSNLLDFARENGKDIGKVADMIRNVYNDDENVDVLGKLFLELYDDMDW